jgi:SMI1 / KNR4 family (SUKH-1)
MLECLAIDFPTFYQRVNSGHGDPVDAILPPVAEHAIERVEQQLGIPLPESYKRFLRCTGGFCLLGGAVNLSFPPFIHDFPPFESLTSEQQSRITGSWPPPSHGLLCFGDFWLEGDGDQVLFDTRQVIGDGEYPVLYYDHEAMPASIRPIAASFHDWLERVLTEESFRA